MNIRSQNNKYSSADKWNSKFPNQDTSGEETNDAYLSTLLSLINPSSQLINKDDAVQDNNIEDLILEEDHTMEEKNGEDKIIEDKTVEGKITKDNIMKDKIMKENITNKKNMEEKIMSEKNLKDRIMLDKIIKNKILEDKIINDKNLKDSIMKEKIMKDKLIKEKIIKDIKAAKDNLMKQKIMDVKTMKKKMKTKTEPNFFVPLPFDPAQNDDIAGENQSYFVWVIINQ